MRRLTDETGLAGTVLVIVIAWALVAVLMLTRTLVAAQTIEDHVDVILSEVGPGGVVDDTALVAVLQDTERIAADIDTAAAPLSGQLDQIISTAGSIDGSVTNILNTAQSINSTAKSIGGIVNSINGNLSSILGVVREINCGNDIANPNLGQIVEACGQKGVHGINLRVDVIIGLVRGINSDTSAVLNQVVQIHDHANAIDCSVPTSVLLGPLTGGGAACGAHPGD